MSKSAGKIYPFDCTLTAKDNLTAKVQKVTQNGLQVHTAQPLLVNSKLKAAFVLPLKNFQIETDVLVVRTFDEFKGKKGDPQPTNHVVELAFVSLTQQNKQDIYDFLLYIRTLKD